MNSRRTCRRQAQRDLPGFRAIVNVPPHCVRLSQPAKEVRELQIRDGPNDKIAVIRHQRPGNNRQDYRLIDAIFGDPSEGFVIAWLPPRKALIVSAVVFHGLSGAC